MKIKDLTVGSSCEITLVVKSATPRKTRANKDYLQLELFDGVDTINGNYWDWASGKVPEPNAILDVVATVTEWQGAKQLSVTSLVTNNNRVLSEFAPSSPYDISDAYKEAYIIAGTVTDDFLRDLTLGILEELRVLWLDIPGAKSIHHAFVGGTLVHSVHVAKIAKAIAEQIPDSSIDLCIAGGLLHDIGKLFTYKMNGVSIDMTDEGLLYDHIFMGAEFVGNYADNFDEASYSNVEYKRRLLRHIILAHHGKLEYGSPVTPKCIEAMIVHAADGIDASAEQVRAAASKTPNNVKWTERLYTLNNSPCLVPDYIKAVFD